MIGIMHINGTVWSQGGSYEEYAQSNQPQQPDGRISNVCNKINCFDYTFMESYIVVCVC